MELDRDGIALFSNPLLRSLDNSDEKVEFGDEEDEEDDEEGSHEGNDKDAAETKIRKYKHLYVLSQQIVKMIFLS